MSSQGGYVSGHQGAAATRAAAPFETTTAGLVHHRVGVTSAAATVILYDAGAAAGDDLPVTWLKLWFWCDVDCHLQLIELGTPTNVIIPVIALDPFTMSTGKLLAAAANTILNEKDATLVEIDKIMLGVSAAANYRLILIL